MTAAAARRWLALALLVHVVLAGTYAWRTPAWEGPDENDHAYYASYLAATGRQPTILRSAATSGRSAHEEAPLGHHPPLYYFLLGQGTALLTGTDHVPYWSPEPAFGKGTALKWRHGRDEQAPVSAEIRVLRGQRAFSAALGAGALALTWALARVLLPARPGAAAGAALLLACLPQWSWMHGVLDNGNLATVLALAVLLVLARALRAGALGPGTGTAVGGLLGAALLTKLTALFLLPAAALGYGWALYAWRGARARVLTSAALALAVTAAISGAWFWRNEVLYGDPLALAPHAVAYATNRVPDGMRLHWLAGDFVSRSLHSLFAGVGWALQPAPPAAELAAAALVAAGLLGFFRRARTFLREGGPPLVLALAAFALTVAGLVQFNAGFFQPQGRYLFPTLGVLAIVVAAGLTGAPHGRWLGPLLALAGTVLAFVLQHRWFLPMLEARPIVDPHYASYHAGVRVPGPPARRTLVLDAPAPHAECDGPPAFAWRDPDGDAGRAYTLVFVLASGFTVATFETAGLALPAGTWTMPDQYWAALPVGEAVRWRVRRIADRARGEAAAAQPESEQRVLVRRR